VGSPMTCPDIVKEFNHPEKTNLHFKAELKEQDRYYYDFC